MDFPRIFDILHAHNLSAPALGAFSYLEKNKWNEYSISEFTTQVFQVSAGLLKLDVSKGDKVLFLSGESQFQWSVFDFGTQQIGAISIYLKPIFSKEQLHQIISDLEVKVVLVQNAELYQTLEEIKTECPCLLHIFCIQKETELKRWRDLIDQPNEDLLTDLDAFRGVIIPQDIVSITVKQNSYGKLIFTEWSHEQIMKMTNKWRELLKINQHARHLTFNAVDQIFDRSLVYAHLSQGSKSRFLSLKQLALKYFKKHRPEIITTDEATFLKMIDLLSKKNLHDEFPSRRARWAVAIAKKYDWKNKPPFQAKFILPIIRSLVFKRWKKKLGNKIKVIGLGDSHVNQRTKNLLHAMQIKTVYPADLKID